MDEILRRYANEEIEAALRWIDEQLDGGYLDISIIPDQVEMDIVEAAIDIFKEKLKQELILNEKHQDA